MNELKIRIPLPRAADHLCGEIDAHSLRGLECREQIARATANLQDAPAGRDEEAVHLCEPTVVIPTPSPVIVVPAGDLVPVALARLAIGDIGGSTERGGGCGSGDRHTLQVAADRTDLACD